MDGSVFGCVYLYPQWVEGEGDLVELVLRLRKVKCYTAHCAAAGLYIRQVLRICTDTYSLW